MSAPQLILGSSSRFRARLLEQAGVPFEQDRPAVDEEMVKEAIRGEGLTPRDQAGALAEIKALSLSRRYPDALVLGCDQVLELEGHAYDKPADMDEARAQLLTFRGKTHILHSAMSIAENNRPIWRHIEPARLTMRDFSDDFIETYIARCGVSLLETVGAYQLEGLGVQLFARIDGSQSAIEGLPLLPLLGYLRMRGVIAR